MMPTLKTTELTKKMLTRMMTTLHHDIQEMMKCHKFIMSPIELRNLASNQTSNCD